MNLRWEVHRLLQDYAAALRQCLGDSLVGAYVYGSIVWDAYDPASSDVDVAVLLGEPCAPETVDGLAGLHDELARRHPLASTLDASYIPLSLAGQYSNFNLPFYRDGRFVARGGGDVNPVTWHTLHSRGMPIVGPPAAKILPPVSPADLQDTMWYNLGFLSGRMPAYAMSGIPNTLFGVTSLCRVLYTLRTGEITSKRGALEWATDHVAEEWVPTCATCEYSLLARDRHRRPRWSTMLSCSPDICGNSRSTTPSSDQRPPRRDDAAVRPEGRRLPGAWESRQRYLFCGVRVLQGVHNGRGRA